MDQSIIIDAAPRAGIGSFAERVRGWFRRMAQNWREHMQFLAEVDHLMSATDRDLADIGLTRHDLAVSRRAGRFIRAADHE